MQIFVLITNQLTNTVARSHIKKFYTKRWQKIRVFPLVLLLIKFFGSLFFINFWQLILNQNQIWLFDNLSIKHVFFTLLTTFWRIGESTENSSKNEQDRFYHCVSDLNIHFCLFIFSKRSKSLHPKADTNVPKYLSKALQRGKFVWIFWQYPECHQVWTYLCGPAGCNKLIKWGLVIIKFISLKISFIN
jgi:hypothetical protein